MNNKRKTYHKYWEFNEHVQEAYLNLRCQIGYLKAGYYLRREWGVLQLYPLMFASAIAQVGISIALSDLSKNGLLGKDKK